jgi:soluble lytic murein transglycosylase
VQKAGVRRLLSILFLLVAVGMAGWFLWSWRNSKEHRYDGLIREVARQHGLPPALVKAVIWRESAFNAVARGSVGELGLMQVTEGAAQEWADARRDRRFQPAHLYHPVTNLHAGCHYLAKVTRRYLRTDQPYAFALADYNAGRGNVLRWMQQGGETNAALFLQTMTFPGTRNYVRSVLQRSVVYERDFRP